MQPLYVLNTQSDLVVPDKFSGYIVFYKKSKEQHVADVQLGLFQKLIENGLKLSLSNFLLVDIFQYPVRISVLKKNLTFHKCFLFGVKENEVGLNFNLPLYKHIYFSEIDFIKSDAPEVLEQDKNLKNKLWIQLQSAFNLSK